MNDFARDGSKCVMATLKELLQDTASHLCGSTLSMLYHLPAHDTGILLG